MTADVEKDADAAAQFASAAGRAFEEVKAQMPSVGIRETSCAAIDPAGIASNLPARRRAPDDVPLGSRRRN